MFKKSILPLAALIISITSVSYVACQQGRSIQVNDNSSSSLKIECLKFETEYNELKSINGRHIEEYAKDMGCNSNSNALQTIIHRNSLLEKNHDRLQFYKMQIAQRDLKNRSYNLMNLATLRTDFEQLIKDGKEIRSEIVAINGSHVSK